MSKTDKEDKDTYRYTYTYLYHEKNYIRKIIDSIDEYQK